MEREEICHKERNNKSDNNNINGFYPIRVYQQYYSDPALN